MADSDVDHFYRARGIADPDVITDDRRCIQCGYQLRGLKIGNTCPECGRRVLRDRFSGLNEVPIRILLQLRTALSLALLSWIVGMALWLWCYYGLLRFEFAGPVLGGLMVVLALPAVVIATAAWNEVEQPPAEIWKSITSMMRLVVALALVGLALLVFLRSPWAPRASLGTMIAVVTATSLMWVGLQAMGCLLFRRIAAEGGDSHLADRYWNLSWGLGLCIAFISPFIAFTQNVGGTPMCCNSGYLVVIGFFVIQIFFAVSTLRLRSIVKWAIRYRGQYEGKTAEMIERIEAARRIGDAESTALTRE